MAIGWAGRPWRAARGRERAATRRTRALEHEGPGVPHRKAAWQPPDHTFDHVLPGLGWSRARIPGRKPALSDAELLCLATAQHLLGISSERKWIRYAHKHLAGMFPNLPGQSGFGKRLRNQAGLVSAVITALARDIPSWTEDLRLLDSTPLPCGQSRETVKRSDLSGQAGYGYCASHSRYFWGFRL